MLKDSLKNRLEIAKSKISKKDPYKDRDQPSPIGAAFKLSTELVAAVAIGTIIGFILDKTFGTTPWLIIIFFFFRCDRWNYKCVQICKKYARIR